MQTSSDTNGERIQVGQLEVIFFAKKRDTDGHADVFEIRIPPGAKVPGAHHHVGVDETLIGIEGVMTYVVGEQVYEIGPGQRAFSPRGIVHYFLNRTDKPARALAIATPAELGPEYFRDAAAVLAAAAGGPPDMQKLFEVMRRYGVEPAKLPESVRL